MNMDNKSPSSINDDETLKKPDERKKLKLCAPDLKITVGGSLTAVDGGDVDVNENENELAVEYWYHSIIMANHSNCISNEREQNP
jgi:hypothetical protein